MVRLFRFDQDDFASISIVDTSAERAARRRVRAAEARARALALHQSELTIVLNADRRVVFANAALEPITGEHEADIMGSPFEFILDQPSRIEFRRAVDRLLREPAGDRQPTSLHLRTRAALAGNGRSLSCVLANRLDDSTVRGLVLTARDLGPAEKAQARRLRFRERLLELAIQPKSDFTQTLATVLRSTAEVLDVSTASFWRLSRDPDVLRCEALFDRTADRFLRDWVGREFPATRFAAYFAQLMNRQPVVVNDTRTSRLTTMFAGDQDWAHVRALLDVPILVEGTIAGVLCLQHRDIRYWDEDDVGFANTTGLMLASVDGGDAAAGSRVAHRAPGLVRRADRAAEPQPAARDDARHDHDGVEPQAPHGGDADRPRPFQGRQRHARTPGWRRADQVGIAMYCARRSAKTAPSPGWVATNSSC